MTNQYDAGLLQVAAFLSTQEARMIQAAIGVDGLDTLTKAAELGRRLQRICGNAETKAWARKMEVAAGEVLLALVPDQSVMDIGAVNMPGRSMGKGDL